MRALLDSGYAHVAGAFLLMGGWAVFANWAHPMPAPILAGLVQGVLSGLITLGLKRMLEVVVARLPGVAGLVLPPVTACALSILILSTIHSLAGTPEIWRTLMVPTTVATCYAALYTYRLWSRR